MRAKLSRRKAHPKWLLLVGLVVALVGIGCAPPTPTEATPEGSVERVPTERPTPPDAGTPDKVLVDTPPVDQGPPCAPGSTGCRCLPTGLCDKGLRCQQGRCEPCIAGSAGCLCDANKQCQKGLACEAGICRGCEGKAHCACFANGHCNPGLRCQTAAAGKALCSPCQRGQEQGCQCKTDADCGSFLCVNFTCLDPTKAKQVPTNPACYSPCQGDVKEADGKVLACHPKYRLRRGCLGGQRCHEGSCVPEAAQQLDSSAYPYCQQDAHCPSWQACLSGRCYSNCGRDADCGQGFRCHEYVCRRTCQPRKANCPKSSSCYVLEASDEGVCVPKNTHQVPAPGRTQTMSVFTVFPAKLSFEKNTANKEVLLENQSAFSITVSIHRSTDSLNSTKPMAWIKIDECKRYNQDRSACQGFAGRPSSREPYTLTIPAKEKVILQLSGASQSPGAKGYEGIFRVSTKEANETFGVAFRNDLGGRWKGKMFSFGNFNDAQIHLFPDKTSSLKISKYSNAFLQQWLNVKSNQVSYPKFVAILQSLQTESWAVKQNLENCRKLYSTQQSQDVACYPFSSPNGYEILTFSQRQAPVPSGISSLDFAMDIKAGTGGNMAGRIVSALSLHYPGDPAVTLQLDTTKASPQKQLLKGFQATIDLGARYAIKKGAACALAPQESALISPLLLLDFLANSEPYTTFLRARHECRSNHVPFATPANASSAEKERIKALNLGLSAANPIPNGRTLRRHLEFIDGAIFEENTLFVLLRERFVSFFPTPSTGNKVLSKDVTRYGYLLLTRVKDEVDDFSTKGNAPPASTRCTNNAGCGTNEVCQGGVCLAKSRLQQVTCSSQVVQKALGFGIPSTQSMRAWTSQQMDDLVSVLLTGQSVSNNSNAAVSIEGKDVSGSFEVSYADGGQTHYVHYLCQDTGQFDGGPLNNPKPCPAGSKITYFSLPNVSTLKLRGEACQDKGECNKRFDDMKFGTRGIRLDVPHRCKSGSAFCNDTSDLRKNKVFFRPAIPGRFVSPYTALSNAMYQAFRYRLKFASRSGKSIGFTPTLCAPGTSTLKPYCYDAKVIEDIEARVNCLQYVYSQADLAKKLSPKLAGELKKGLEFAFSFTNRKVNGQIVTDFGFETLNAELKIMLGDEAFTQALTSRFDLAQSALRSFPGDKLEPNGIALTGALGFEMSRLYQSVHYYQLVLDRFYRQIDVFVQSMSANSTSILRIESVTSYLQKILVAASRRTRGWSEIARRYHRMARPTLAHFVLQRSYISTYVEMMVMTHLLRQLALQLKPEQLTQIRHNIRQTTRFYNAALLDMKGVYTQILGDFNAFGLPPGTIPFPAMDRFSSARLQTNAFKVGLRYAKQTLDIARAKELLAVRQKRSFDTQAAAYQSELRKIEANYEAQLIRLCGAIQRNGQPRPAIPAYMDPKDPNTFSGDPCGKVPQSAIFQEILQLERIAISSKQLAAQQKHLRERILAEQDRIRKQCDQNFSLSQIVWRFQNNNRNLNQKMRESALVTRQITQGIMGAIELAMGWKCEEITGIDINSKTKCPLSLVSNGIKIGLLVDKLIRTTRLGQKENQQQKELEVLSNLFNKSMIQTECTICPTTDANCGKPGFARIASQNLLARLTLKLQSLSIGITRSHIDMRLITSRIQQLQNSAQKLMQERNDALALLAEVQATQSDPNTRIYKNDAIISAERTFRDAIREAYRLTLIYEYYTGTTYAKKGELYLIRMIAYGDKNLEAYLSQLEQAFRDFEEDAGKPDLRILVLSLRDDILNIPRTKTTPKGLVPLTLTERIGLLQKVFSDPANFDTQGYLAFPFEISVRLQNGTVSPITYGHKVLYVESEIVGGEIGDDQGRLYLRHSGTSALRLKDDQFKYFSLPPRTAVLNPFFNGTKVFTPEVYQNFRLQDRPLGTSQWQLIFNQASEKVNQDINLSTIDDIRLYIYYTDFTK